MYGIQAQHRTGLIFYMSCGASWFVYHEVDAIDYDKRWRDLAQQFEIFTESLI